MFTETLEIFREIISHQVLTQLAVTFIYGLTILIAIKQLFRPIHNITQAPPHFVKNYLAIYSVSFFTRLLKIALHFICFFLGWWLLYYLPTSWLSHELPLAPWKLSTMTMINGGLWGFWWATLVAEINCTFLDRTLKLDNISFIEIENLFKKYRIPDAYNDLHGHRFATIGNTSVDYYNQVFTYGTILRAPRIVFSPSLTIPKWEKPFIAILLHELAHAKSGDLIFTAPYSALNFIERFFYNRSLGFQNRYIPALITKILRLLFWCATLVVKMMNFLLGLTSRVIESVDSRFCEIFCDLESAQVFMPEALICGLNDLDKKRLFNYNSPCTHLHAKKITHVALEEFARERGISVGLLSTYFSIARIQEFFRMLASEWNSTIKGATHPQLNRRILLLANFSDYITTDETLKKKLIRTLPNKSLYLGLFIAILVMLASVIRQLSLNNDYLEPKELKLYYQKLLNDKENEDEKNHS